MKRRVFTKSLAVSGLLAATSPITSCIKNEKSLNILVLGGTSFVGPAIVKAGLNENHKITLFNRGITNPTLFPKLRLIKGDREKGLIAYKPLQQEKWDVIIDVWPEKSQLVDDATKMLSDHTDHYTYISSIAVYNDFQEVGLNEKSAVVHLDLPKSEWFYPEEKYAGETFVKKRFPGRHSILRCGAIKGWRDPALDLAYWCLKLTRYDQVIAPGSGMDPIQFVDVKDVGRFAINCSSDKRTGTFNCIGPVENSLNWNTFLAIVKDHFKTTTELIWANEEFLAKNKVASFTDLPLWAPLSEEKGFMQISNTKMKKTNFSLTPISNTLDDCLHWLKQNNLLEVEFGNATTGLGLSREKELKLIAKL